MTEAAALESRHSIRKYLDRPIAADVLAELRAEISRINAESGLNMQIVVNEPKAFKSFLAYGVFSNVTDYIMVIGRNDPSLEYRAGYYAERLVLFAQRLGLNTCIVGLTYKKVHGAYTIAPDEKAVVCIAVGYGADGGRKHKIKSPAQVSNIDPHTPAWFAAGVRAALLAPTAVNQQKFFFEYIAAAPGGKAGVRPSRRFSLAGYTKTDLGIAMYNFEVGAGNDNFIWVDSPL